MRKENVVGVTAVAIVVVSLRPVRQMVKSMFRKVLVVPLSSSIKAAMRVMPSILLPHESDRNTCCHACCAQAYSITTFNHGSRASPTVATRIVTDEGRSLSHSEPLSSDELSDRLSHNDPPNSLQELSCVVNVEPRSTSEMPTLLPSTNPRLAQPPVNKTTSTDVEPKGARENGQNVTTRRAHVSPSASLEQPEFLDLPNPSHVPSRLESVNGQNDESGLVRLRGEWRGRGRDRGRDRGRGHGFGQRGRGRGRRQGKGRGFGFRNTASPDMTGSQHDVQNAENSEDGDGLVTCVKCGAKGHYAGECEHPFGPVRRTWPIGLKALARRLRMQVGEPIIWCD